MISSSARCKNASGANNLKGATLESSIVFHISGTVCELFVLWACMINNFINDFTAKAEQNQY
jgi:hypothetical protein